MFSACSYQNLHQRAPRPSQHIPCCDGSWTTTLPAGLSPSRLLLGTSVQKPKRWWKPRRCRTDPVRSSSAVELVGLHTLDERVPLGAGEGECRATGIFGVTDEVKLVGVGLVPRQDRVAGNDRDFDAVSPTVTAEAALAPDDAGRVHHGHPHLPTRDRLEGLLGHTRDQST